MSAKASSLQVENEADDWTQVEDRQERKRIQNRLAQRIYSMNPSVQCHCPESWFLG